MCTPCCTICTGVQLYTAQDTGSPCHMSDHGGGRGPRYAQMIVKYHTQQNIIARSGSRSSVCPTKAKCNTEVSGQWVQWDDDKDLIGKWSTFAVGPVNAEAINWILIQNYPQSWAHVMWLFKSYCRLKVCLLQHVELGPWRIHVENCSVCKYLNLYLLCFMDQFRVSLWRRVIYLHLLAINLDKNQEWLLRIHNFFQEQQTFNKQQ